MGLPTASGGVRLENYDSIVPSGRRTGVEPKPGFAVGPPKGASGPKGVVPREI
jgi:hypothetical protein